MMGDVTGTVISWAVDTFLYTGVLIAAVLILRRPVAKAFGPRIAYALWLVPLARFVLPPVVLPAWMKPVEAAPAIEGAPIVFETVEGPVVESTPEIATSTIPYDLLLNIGIAFWLIGAVAFLAWRIGCYRAMTRHLLESAVPVGDAGPVRLVETAAVAAPVAFGVRERVIALPPGFMANEDLTARDLAIAHELAHHRGHDLLANLAAQPVLALHWFNPVAWLGWRAMRRDQEAACDARVMTGRPQEDRARYGEVIAACSRDQNLALAAPMAGFREIGPVLGEKAIVHRLRSLGMNTTTRRHRTGLLLVGAAGLVALPLTASVSYAEGESAVETTDVPASSAVAEPDVQKRVWVVKDEDGQIEVETDEDMTEEELAQMEAEIEREVELAELEAERAERDSERMEIEIERKMAEVERHAAEVERQAAETERRVHMMVMKDMAEVEHEVSKDGKVHVIRMSQVEGDGKAKKRVVRKMVIDSSCEVGKNQDKGENVSHICTGVPHDMIINTLTQVRSTIASSVDLSAEDKAEALSEIDAEIEEMKAARRKG
ncbi:M56 family metallopeptidase [Croceicoccus gelatinilyticus]|uniref:M56 family metallopeptidase n=1 Tax=Croceicoccus gelatinilyticus TaxID=2835536 RepID=UPI001BCB1E2E|nr:M56 family metallopeptidase [Croceicoccus gelatinilyticus]MBS7670468.1 antirepressor regulating drug resistance protein [Croceicoccus gelatinilyticus]